jgi:hypothetical protein
MKMGVLARGEICMYETVKKARYSEGVVIFPRAATA